MAFGFGKKKREKEAAEEAARQAKLEARNAQLAADLQRFDERLEEAKTLTNIFNRIVTLDKLYREAYTSSRNYFATAREMRAREKHIVKLQIETVRDNYDLIKGSGLVDRFFEKVTSPDVKPAFDDVTLARAFETQMAVPRTTVLKSPVQ